jgi:hypothetical protein
MLRLLRRSIALKGGYVEKALRIDRCCQAFQLDLSLETSAREWRSMVIGAGLRAHEHDLFSRH